MLGHEVSFKSTEYLLGEAMDFPFDNLGNDYLGLGATPSRVESSYSEKRFYHSLHVETTTMIIGIYLQLQYVPMVQLYSLIKISGDSSPHFQPHGVFRKKLS